MKGSFLITIFKWIYCWLMYTLSASPAYNVILVSLNFRNVKVSADQWPNFRLDLWVYCFWKMYFSWITIHSALNMCCVKSNKSSLSVWFQFDFHCVLDPPARGRPPLKGSLIAEHPQYHSQGPMGWQLCSLDYLITELSVQVSCLCSQQFNQAP